LDNSPLSGPNHAEQSTLKFLARTFRLSLERYFARRVYNRSDVEDLVQQVFERLARRGEIADTGHLGGYVFQTANSVLTDHVRRRHASRFDAHEEFDELIHGGASLSGEQILLERERLTRAMTILWKLPERSRTIFVLRRLERWKYSDIAARLGISVSAVEKHMERAVARLAEGMEQT
jgi:RNA polymerase sigma factor (sigma-70 family)